MNTEEIETEVDSLLELVDHLKSENARLERDSLQMVGAILDCAGGSVTLTRTALLADYEVTRSKDVLSDGLTFSSRRAVK